MAQKEMQEMLRAAFILSIASFIVKLLSAFYRVPYQNLVGDEGFYVYQQVYPLYGLAMTLSLTGLPLFLSKIKQEKKELIDQNEQLKAFFPLVFYSSFVLFISLFFGAKGVALLMHDLSLTPLIRLVSFMYLLTPFLSFLRGNFQGIPWMTPTALSQIGEQFLRVTIILMSAFCFYALTIDVYQTAYLAYLGSLLGGGCAFFILKKENNRATLFALHIDKSWFSWPQKKTYLPLLKRLSIEGGLVFIYSGLLLLYQLLDSFLVKSALEKGGWTEVEAKIQKGIFDRGQPLVQLGLVVALALSSTFLPMLTKQKTHQKERLFAQYSLMYLRLTTTLALAATIGLIGLLPFINYTLFKDTQANLVLSTFLCSIFLFAIIQSFVNIYQSKNQFILPLKGAFLGLSIKGLITFCLTPLFGTLGTSLATISGLCVTYGYLYYKSTPFLKGYYHYYGFFKKLSLSLGTMGVSLFLFRLLFLPFALQSRLFSLGLSIIGVCVGGGVFLVVMIRLHLFTIREWLLLPYGKQIFRFFNR